MKKLSVLAGFVACINAADAQVIWTAAGNGTGGYTGDGGFATAAEIRPNDNFTGSMIGIAVDANKNIYFSDQYNNVVRKITPAGIISTVAGTGTQGYSGDGGAATSATLRFPSGLAVNSSGDLFISDYNNNVIRKVDHSNGHISTYAGTQHTSQICGGCWYGGDGSAATSAYIDGPNGLACDASNNLYIADSYNNVIRMVDNSTGNISTVAGSGYNNGTSNGGFGGDGGSATAAACQMFYPIDVKLNGSDMYIVDEDNLRIRKVSSGTINTIAGNGSLGNTGDGGAATSATLYAPWAIAVNSSGDYFICQASTGSASRVRKVTGTTINAYAGNGTAGYSGDGGAATSAEINTPVGIALDPTGTIVYIADNWNYRIRAVSANCPANAGANKINVCGQCCGTSTVSIGTPSVPSMTYAWTCSGTCNLSSTSAAQPNAGPCNLSTATIYTVSVSGTGCTTNTSTMSVTSHPPMNGCCRLMGPQNNDNSIFSVFPNPASSNVTVTLYGEAEYVRLMDINGKIVFESTAVAKGDLNIDISQYSHGFYVLTARIGGKVEKQKLAIE